MRFLRPAWPDCSLLSVTRLNGVPAQGESPAPPWCQKRAGNGGEPCDEVCRNRAGRVSSRCNVTKSSLATVHVRRFAVGLANNLPEGLGYRIENVLFAVYSRPQNFATFTFFSLRCATFFAAGPLPWLPLPWLWGGKVLRILATFFVASRGDAAREPGRPR